MANCSNCAAPLPPHSILCSYCGSRNDTDLKGVHRYTTHELDSGRTCPRCDSCSEHGLWLDGGELRQLFEWSKAGGSLLAEERRERQRQEKERAERQKMVMATGGDPREFRGDAGRSDTPELELDLLQMLQKVAKFFS